MFIAEQGDTIIEVMVVLTVLSLAFAIASATATRGLNQSRNAQEHSRALGIINSQIESIRVVLGNPSTQILPSDPFCLQQTDSGPVVTETLADCQDGTVDPTYNPRITPVIEGGKLQYYKFEVIWDGITGLGPQRELIYYRINGVSSI